MALRRSAAEISLKTHCPTLRLDFRLPEWRHLPPRKRGRLNDARKTVGVVSSASRARQLHPNEPTFKALMRSSESGQGTKSLRSSPLRGGKSGEIGSKSRERR
jgi:hypothetical protein